MGTARHVNDWTDKVVVVTGASRGLGAAVARAFARRGARVALLARSGPDLRRLADEISTSGGHAACWPMDLCDWPAVRRNLHEVADHWGRIDVLVCAAGTKREGTVEQASLEDALDTLRVNYLGVLVCCQAVLPIMRRQGGGHVIPISSVLGKRATPQRGLYAASKAALNALTDALRVEVAPDGIAVTLVCPGRLAQAHEPPGLTAMAVDEAAERIVRCAERRPREIVLSGAARGLVAWHERAPGLLDRVLSAWRRLERRPPRIRRAADGAMS